ncbi:M15 family metallopeptidase [Comamonas sp. C24C]
MAFNTARVAMAGQWFKTGLAATALGLIAGCASLTGAAPGTQAPAEIGTARLVKLSSVAPGVRQDMRYATRHNFLGRPVAGYEAGECWLSRAAAESLAAVQSELAGQGLALKVYDCYRPQKAVDDFVRWGRDLADQKNKDMYYPRVPKSELFKRGYIAEKSGHSRASTVDMTLVVVDARRASKWVRGPLAEGIEVDMGTPFDLFDEQSHTDNAQQSPDVQHNRRWLRSLMQRNGWKNLPEEWWHYTLVGEPYPEQYFDMPVRSN